MAECASQLDLEAVLGRYKAVQPIYAALASHLQERLAEMAREEHIYPLITGRAKSVESLAEKVRRPGKNYGPDPLARLTDLCGVRVIVHTLDEVAVLAARVRQMFAIDAVHSGDKGEELPLGEFGYASKHLILQIRSFPTCPGDAPADFFPVRAELQLRTLAQHTWADVYHELGYKNEFELPRQWKRELAKVAAQLEDVDDTFARIKTAISALDSNYGAYLTQDQLRRLAERLEAVLTVEPDNRSAAHRLIRAHLALRLDDRRVRELMGRPHLREYGPALRDAGVVYCQAHAPGTPEFEEGRAFLERAVKLDARDIDARCSLAGALRKEGRALREQGHGDAARERYECARDRYREGHDLDNTNPYPLGNYVTMELMLGKGPGIVGYFKHYMRQAADRCRKQIEVQVNLPWAFFDLGLFHLYLGEPDLALQAYAAGVNTATEPWMIRSARANFLDLIEASAAIDGVSLLELFLRVAQWVRTSQDERPHLGFTLQRGPLGFEKPVLIVAGGCGGMNDPSTQHLAALRRGLATFRGTIVSGGTRSGIAEIVGDIQEQCPTTIETVGYVPAETGLGPKEQLDTRYRFHRNTNGNGFSPRESLMFWEEFLAAGGDPRLVKLLGFNGGAISASEYRVALALGAQVGIVSASGRAADEMLSDSAWKGAPNCIALEPSSEEIGRFVKGERMASRKEG